MKSFMLKGVLAVATVMGLQLPAHADQVYATVEASNNSASGSDYVVSASSGEMVTGSVDPGLVSYRTLAFQPVTTSGRFFASVGSVSCESAVVGDLTSVTYIWLQILSDGSCQIQAW